MTKRHDPGAPALEYGAIDVLTFDCYGTLIDWESGILAALRRELPGAAPFGDDELLERYAHHEAAAERPPYRSYRSVLAETVRALASEQGLDLADEGVARFAGSVPDWPEFPDTVEALRRLRQRFRLGVITNCDDDLFAASNRRLGVDFDWVVTAEQTRSYKPARRPFDAALEQIDASPERILHVAQSLFHDHVPAKALGVRTVWIDRRHDRPGFGATPPASVEPDAAFTSLRDFADAATSGA